MNQHLEHGRRLSELADENGISLHCAYLWLTQYRFGGPASLSIHRSMSHTQRRALNPLGSRQFGGITGATNDPFPQPGQ
ncbi:hypothetical protein H8F24_14835 [Synechococcus sp. CBW1002]|uniref:hypothetical protein n=1 Tax=Synechococcus sp. CBW1006 TaxID=1353138 RepID=UPI0018CCE639|nr:MULTISPECIES: hypothetical protein [unclassified Synechococcus]QPN59298.1 hypothetical protein H8F24_14835 [Synechococcus sp. CBW1002]QPN67153.1 hypothetical protein H8F26_02465 [Synechococcus sp. CBW1006]QPN67169.1 hypothetical protein H8F26_02600 [Synechococcus sp. CBW1006]